MDWMKLNLWIQTVSGIAIVIGLALVIWELQQNREAVQSQLTSDGWQMNTQFDTTLLGEAPFATLAKACEHPDMLSAEELTLLHRYFNTILNIRIRRLRYLPDRGSFYPEGYWKEFAEIPLQDYVFPTAAGRAWWRSIAGYTTGQDILELGNALLEAGAYVDCRESMEQWRKQMSEEAAHSPTADAP